MTFYFRLPFKKIIEDTETKINGTLIPTSTKLFVYSGHDITILTLFAVLDIENMPEPLCGSYCMLEVHYMNGTYGFKVIILTTLFLQILHVRFPTVNIINGL